MIPLSLTLLALLLWSTPRPCPALSVPLSPLLFTLRPSDLSPTWSNADLAAFSTAAQKYIDDHSLLASALEPSGVRYDAIRFSASRGSLRGGSDVALDGTVEISSSSSESVPSPDKLTDTVRTLFQNGETLFVKTLLGVAAENDGVSQWMTRVTGYRVARDGSSLVVANAAPTASVPTLFGINLFLVVGVVGAAVSFLLLLAGLCYAKRRHGGAQKDRRSKKDVRVRESILKNPSPTTAATAVVDSPSSQFHDDDDDDDESNADFLLARAALNNSHSAIQPRGGGNASVVSGTHSSYGDDNVSYAFSVEGESVLGGASKGGDVAIGAGGVSAFRNENGGVFRWNEDGTKMVYVPATSIEDRVKTQNGFVYDESQKKWVLAQKNVSFQSGRDDADSSFLTPPRRMQRVRTDDSAVTGFTEFSYDDVAVGTHGEMMRVPSTPQEEGVEVMAEDDDHDDDGSEFAPNANVERFLMDDESTMFGSVLDGLNDSDTVTLPPPPPPLPKTTMARPVSPDESMVSMRTEEPGIIRRVPSINEDTPFDEDIPFDERPKRRSSTRKIENGKRSVMAGDDGSESEGSADSSRVLSDLNKLSKFMMERKRSTKGSVARSNSGGSHTRSR